MVCATATSILAVHLMAKCRAAYASPQRVLQARSAPEFGTGGILKAAKVTVKVVDGAGNDAPIVPPAALGAGSDRFGKFAARCSHYLGSRWAFAIAIAVILIWVLTGPFFHYSDTWQLIINTGTTIVTFLMVFLIQNTQNRDARAIHLKLNELIHAVDKAKNQMIDVESLSDLELEALAKTYEGIRTAAQDRLKGEKKTSHKSV
jgi:low affinity Fe/Cu permease